MSVAAKAVPARSADDRALPDLARVTAAVMLIAGLVGFAAAFELAIEKFRLLDNPLYVPPCTLGEVVDCTSVMRSEQSEAFGFPNPFLGIGGFAGLFAAGLILITGGRVSRPFWLALQAGLVFAVCFVHWLMFQTLYRIGAVCPFCMAVWAVTIPAFWYVTLQNTREIAARRTRIGPILAAVHRNHGVVLTAWLLAVVALVAERFWAPWDSVFA